MELTREVRHQAEVWNPSVLSRSSNCPSPNFLLHPMDPSVTSQFVEDQVDLLNLESKAQMRQTLLMLNSYPSQVRVVSYAKASFGGTMLSVAPINGAPGSMKVGGRVELTDSAKHQRVKGVVVSNSISRVVVHVPIVDTAVSDSYEIRCVPLCLRKSFLKNLQDIHEMSSRLGEVLLGRSPQSPGAIPELPTLEDIGLDTSQRSAVAFAMSQPEIALIWGPPGNSTV